MDKEELKVFIAKRVAKEFANGSVVNLGIGIPTLVPNYLPEGVDLILQSESGIISMGPRPEPGQGDPYHILDASGRPSSVLPGGSFNDTCTAFALMRGGHVDFTVLGAMQVDQEGNLANWTVPGKKLAGMGGAMDLVIGAKKVIVAMEHTAKGDPKLVKKCTLPLTAVNCVDMIVTEMGVFQISDKRFVLTEYNPAFTVDEIRAATDADIIVAENLKPMC